MGNFKFRILVILSTGFVVMKTSELVHSANNSVADALAHRVRVTCGVFLRADDTEIAHSIANTWGKRCNELFFLSGANELSTKTPLYRDQRHLRYMRDQSAASSDWYLLATTGKGYIVVENLRYMLADHDPNNAIYFMLVVSENRGVTYVLSRKAFDMFMKTDTQISVCRTDIDDDVARENCFKAIGIKLMDSQDSLKRDRFFAGDPYTDGVKQERRKFWDCRDIPEKPGDCYSDYAISFDDVDPHMKYVLDYLIYQLRPYGIKFGENLPKILRRSYFMPENDFPVQAHDAEDSLGWYPDDDVMTV
ncbi:glycoprotein-N-acetylgalactosamine 3-beta-galactosyltransferase 1-like [Amyelois transitella]|uniref:glycoprotein-N-acetylgalactosamine 3-beta-galactosyltransferase 1-like n=1 Tax=Amyelois transitella TaxID=680683 RepID=UPI00067C49D7|nr:glycoprotein-N-acetylgalactosamine 3-beta-galactosyltransferase 1-like [Amyelois transitella]